MLDPVFQFFERMVSDFSWKRIILVVTVLGVIFGVAYIYESQTGHFELQKAGKEIALLTDLIALSERAGTKSDPEVQRAIQNLKSRLRESTEPKEGSITVSVTYKKVFAAALAWIVLGVLMLLASTSESSTTKPGTTITGIAIAAIPFVVLAGFLPTFQATWINYYLYPIGHMVIVMALIVSWHKKKLAKEQPNKSLKRTP